MLLELIQEPGSEPQFKPLSDWPAGLMYGMAVYTTFRLPLAEHWIAAHLDRLMGNAEQLGLQLAFGPELLQQALLPHFQLERPVFRLTLVADVEEYNDFYQKTPKPARLLLATREAAGENPLPLNLRSVDYTRTMPLLKHLGMADVISLKRKAKLEGYQEILLAGAGKIREASTANIFFVKSGALYSPNPERDDCLPGITRQRVLKEAAKSGVIIHQAQPIRLEQLTGMDGAFLTNAARGLIPVARIDDMYLPWPDSAKELAHLFAESLN